MSGKSSRWRRFKDDEDDGPRKRYVSGLIRLGGFANPGCGATSDAAVPTLVAKGDGAVEEAALLGFAFGRNEDGAESGSPYRIRAARWGKNPHRISGRFAVPGPDHR